MSAFAQMRSGTGQATLGGGGKDPSKPPGIGPCAAHSHGKLESVARKAVQRSLVARLPKNMRSRAIEFNTKPHGRRHGPRPRHECNNESAESPASDDDNQEEQATPSGPFLPCAG